MVGNREEWPSLLGGLDIIYSSLRIQLPKIEMGAVMNYIGDKGNRTKKALHDVYSERLQHEAYEPEL